MVMSHYDGYRRGCAGDAPVITKLGRNEVGLRPDQSTKTLCLNSKHITRKALDKSLEDRQLIQHYSRMSTGRI